MLVASVMNDEKENQIISNGLEVIFNNEQYVPAISKEKLGKERNNLAIAYQVMQDEAKKNQSLKWQDGSDVVLFGEKVKMFQSTENQYKNSQIFGYLNYPSVSQYPNNSVATLDDLSRLNGLDNNSLKYRHELFNIIGNSHKDKQDNAGVLNKTYYDYFVTPTGRVEPIAPELYAIGGVANGLNRAVASGISTGSKVASQANSVINNFATKYPNLSGAVADGLLSGGTHIGYKLSTGQDINGYELGGAIAGGALTRNHSVGNQIRINVGIATISSLSKDPSGGDLTNAYWGAVTSPISGYLFNKVPIVGEKLSPMSTEYFGDLEYLEKTYKFIEEKVDGIKKEK